MTGLLLALSLAASSPSNGSERAPRATLMAFFATWCVPCRGELPHIEALHRTHTKDGLRVLLVSEDAPSTAANVEMFLSRFDVTADWIVDRDSELLIRYHPTGSLPYVVLLDHTGKIAYAHSGYEPGDEVHLSKAVRALLARPLSDNVEPARQYSARVTTQGLAALRQSRFETVEGQDGQLQIGALRSELTGRLESAECSAGSPCTTASVRLDGATVSDDGARVGQPRDQSAATLERASLDLDLGFLRVRGGDSHVAFGSGVSLSLRRVDLLGMDAALRGGRIDGTLGPIKLTAVAGQINTQDLDPISFRIRDDVRDTVAGASLALRQSLFSAELYSVVAKADNAATDGRACGRLAEPCDVTWHSTGTAGELELPFGGFTWDAAMGRRSEKSDEIGYTIGGKRAYAIYSATRVEAGATSTVIETKAYRNWQMGRREQNIFYHEPPTLEREDQQVPGNRDTVGARVHTQWRVRDAATVYGNILGYQFTKDETSPFESTANRAFHGYLGGEMRPHANLSFAIAGGYRMENRTRGSTQERVKDISLWHGDVDGAYAHSEQLAVTLKWNHVSETKFLPDPEPFVRGLGVLGIAIPGVGALSALYGYSTESAALPTHYPGAELKLQLPKGGDVRLFLGRSAGGRVCVSGSCRDVPPFEGVRADVVVEL